MGKDSGIQWTTHTFNPWWGCEKVSPGCKLCYAEAFADGRLHLNVWGADAPRRFFGDSHWHEPERWNLAAKRKGERHRVFCASMCDVFEARPDLARHRARLWALIEETPHLDWLLLTKRPENIRGMLPNGFTRAPWRNVWLGTTTENQDTYDARMPALLDVPAVVHLASMEPLLGPVNLRGYRPSWLIIGGESDGRTGEKARAFDSAWGIDIARQAEERGTAVFWKQWGARALWQGKPWAMRDSHGGNPDEWPRAFAWRRDFPVPYLGYAKP